jgi:glycosyltransferase involved in cell wall biosynthesis
VLVKIGIILGDGIEGQGGTEKATGYLTQYLQSINFSEFELQVMRTRVGATNFIRHLTTPFVIAGFFFRFLFRRYDLAHVNVGPKGSTYRKIGVCMILVSLGIPYLVHLHGSGYDAYYRSAPPLLQYLIRFTFVRAKLVVVLGELWRQFAVSDLGVAEANVRIVYNGVPDHGVSSYTTRNAIKITSLGLVGTRKGTDVLLQALALLPTRIAWRCIIGGNGKLSFYAQMSSELGIQDRVEFLGWIDGARVVSLLHETDIFVLASRFENQPLTILEAMAAGVPVISTRIGAIPEQIRDGISGILVEPGDAEALRDALMHLIENQEERIAMGRAGRKRYQESFSVRAFADNMVAVYREALAGSR